MLRISKLADYATVVMTHMAQQPAIIHNATTIAEHTRLGVPTVRKLLKLLHIHGLLTSSRGTKGGYRLAYLATEISVDDIIAAVEPRVGLTECSESKGYCALEPYCSIGRNWRVINQAVQAALKSVTLADLAKPHMTSHKIDISQLKRLVGEDHGKHS